MKRTFATLLAVSAVALAEDSCPCFTAEEYGKIFDVYPHHGCVFNVKEDDPETVSMAMAYIWETHHKPIGVVQSSVSIENINKVPVEGGVCGVGSMKVDSSFPLENTNVQDYGDGLYAPQAFQKCADIMQAKCEEVCGDRLKSFGEEGRKGCGRLPFSTE